MDNKDWTIKNGKLTILNKNKKIIRCQNSGITSLYGDNTFPTEIFMINCDNNKLYSLFGPNIQDIPPNTLEVLICSINYISSLYRVLRSNNKFVYQFLHDDLTRINCIGNKITRLSGPNGKMIIPKNLDDLFCDGNQITSICGPNGKVSLPDGFTKLYSSINPIQINSVLLTKPDLLYKFYPPNQPDLYNKLKFIRPVGRISKTFRRKEKLKIWSMGIIS